MKMLFIPIFVNVVFMYSCTQVSDKELHDAKEQLRIARTDLIDSRYKEKQDAKTIEIAEWNRFKNESDRSIENLDRELKKMAVEIEKTDKNELLELKADFNKTKTKLVLLNEKLYKRNLDFDNDLMGFDEKISKKNSSFKLQFKQDMDAVGQSCRGLFNHKLE